MNPDDSQIPNNQAARASADFDDDYIIEYDPDHDPVVEAPPAMRNRKDLDRVHAILDEIQSKQGREPTR